MYHILVVDDEEIRLAAIQYMTDIGQPVAAEMGVHGVHDGDFFIHDDIRIVAHTVGDGIQTFK